MSLKQPNHPDNTDGVTQNFLMRLASQSVTYHHAGVIDGNFGEDIYEEDVMDPEIGDITFHKRRGENPFEPDSKVAINDFDKEMIDDFNPDTFTDGLDRSLPPLSDLKEIFLDMTSRALNMLPGLKLAVKHLQDRPLRVATMCSGTESPIIALNIIFECKYQAYFPAISKSCKKTKNSNRSEQRNEPKSTSHD